MTNLEFVDYLHDYLGLEYTVEQITLSMDDLPGWDSVHLLRLMSNLPTGVSPRDILSATSLDQVRKLLTA